MLVYTINVQDRFGNKDALLTTTDKQLANATLSIINYSELAKVLKIRSIMSIKDDDDEPITWWFEENFGMEFVDYLWIELKKRDIDPSFK